MSKHCSYKGFWSLQCDDETTSSTCAIRTETMLQMLRKLPERYPELFPISPTSKNFPIKGNVLVIISEDSEEEIEKSAETIRSCVDFPFVMYYFKKRVSDFRVQNRYMHTPDFELYRFNNQDKGAVNFWKLIGQKGKLNTTADNLLPSQVTDRDHIRIPVSEEDFEKAVNEKGGKWILHCSDWESLDCLWKNLIRLYDTGVLVAIKSCTPRFVVSEISPNYKTKAIMCYTADADCKPCVKKAADSIFICTGYKFMMYYKSNAASKMGQYVHEGFNRVTKYMYTSSREIFEKDHLKRWKKINFDNEKHK
ncbi:hypothetical protein HNY73_022223 [Argiope bruennichi]|uniref:Uncharacterized protein n=1 Tax=Argiope bruennichi TaxID=94029 RepID=A0A8T0E1U8_ARGBR|nr:hypothetical protein HNY73_022223 [Argiope bruennichi]